MDDPHTVALAPPRRAGHDGTKCRTRQREINDHPLSHSLQSDGLRDEDRERQRGDDEETIIGDPVDAVQGSPGSPPVHQPFARARIMTKSHFERPQNRSELMFQE